MVREKQNVGKQALGQVPIQDMVLERQVGKGVQWKNIKDSVPLLDHLPSPNLANFDLSFTTHLSYPVLQEVSPYTAPLKPHQPTLGAQP